MKTFILGFKTIIKMAYTYFFHNVLICVSIYLTNAHKINHTVKNEIKFSNDINDYYQNYDYELSNNLSEHLDSESVLLPNPESFEAKYTDTIDILPNVDIPDNSLADTDLHDHDFIDNLMYIYYGTHTKNGYTFGAEIIIIGSVLSCAAQFLTIICTFLRKESKNETSKLFLNTVFCLCVANLLFMLGVHATKYRTRCEIIAVLLHYLHLVTAVWIFTTCYYVFKRLLNEYIPNVRFLCILSYGAPAVLILLCYGVSPNSYESKKFCWMSVKKGMFLNYMLPVTTLIIITTLISLSGIRKINFELSKYELSSTDSIITTIDLENKTKLFEKSTIAHVDIQITGDNAGVVISEKSDEEDIYLSALYACKKCLKVLSIVQTSYVVVWFIAVLALENAAYSTVMPIIYAICSCILNWYIFAKSKYLTPDFKNLIGISDNSPGVLNDTQQQCLHSIQENSISQCDASDNVPLLHGSDNFTELIELRTESISTISN